MQPKRNRRRYSEAFKRQILKELTESTRSKTSMARQYGVSVTTLNKWLTQYGKSDCITPIQLVKMKHETDQLKTLHAEKRALEAALAQAHIKILMMESTLESVDDYYQIDSKKNFAPKPLTGLSGIMTSKAKTPTQKATNLKQKDAR